VTPGLTLVRFNRGGDPKTGSEKKRMLSPLVSISSIRAKGIQSVSNQNTDTQNNKNSNDS
jgi:hypothetical protein